jgi:hypothetical protein
MATARTAITGLAERLRPMVSKDKLAAAWSWLAASTFARYLLVFFAGVIVTVVWQSLSQPQQRAPQRLQTGAATPADVDSVRQSIDKLAAEVSKIRTVEQGILDRVSAGSPAAVPVRNSVQRAAPR